MSADPLVAAAAVAAGVAASLQAAANASLAARTGLGAALVVNGAVVFAATLAFWFGAGSRGPVVAAGAPWTAYLGGLFGFSVVACACFAFPRLGGGAAVALMVLGQGAAALAIDQLGLFGSERHPATAARLAGLALLCAGVFLLRKGT